MTTGSTRSRSVARAGFAGRSSGALGRGRSRSRCCTACLNELSVQVPNALYLLGGQVLVYVYTWPPGPSSPCQPEPAVSGMRSSGRRIVRSGLHG